VRGSANHVAPNVPSPSLQIAFSECRVRFRETAAVTCAYESSWCVRPTAPSVIEWHPVPGPARHLSYRAWNSLSRLLAPFDRGRRRCQVSEFDAGKHLRRSPCLNCVPFVVVRRRVRARRSMAWQCRALECSNVMRACRLVGILVRKSMH
jgi:hypothetical protein